MRLLHEDLNVQLLMTADDHENVLCALLATDASGQWQWLADEEFGEWQGAAALGKWVTRQVVKLGLVKVL
jgi:hypothetical protein